MTYKIVFNKINELYATTIQSRTWYKFLPR